MSKKLILFVSLLVAVSLLVTPALAAGDSPYAPLVPGEHTTYEQKVPINLVFVGYTPDQVDTGEVLAALPDSYDPVVRYPLFYGVEGRDLGLKFNFNYKTFFAPEKFNTKFFKFLQKIGIPGDPTLFQQYYNDNETNVLDVAGPVLYLDAPSVESYLVTAARSMLKLDTRTGYTIFFINWFGAPDFKFHVYTKTDQPDPDTGYNFGEVRDSRKMIAWGGSSSRTWFYDLSAGPESWTDNYIVDFTDLDGDGYEDYRMPPIWEYTDGGYRSPSALSGDLGLITRFVGINLLFTSSPLYDPLVTAPGANGAKVTHVELFEDDPASSGLDWISQPFIYSMLSSFQPYYKWNVALEDNDPIDAGAQRALFIGNGLLSEDDCWSFYGTPFAQFYCYFNSNLDLYIPRYGANDYVGEIFAFNTTDENMGWNFGLLGFADDNWVDGTQSHVFQFDTPTYRDLGYGLSSTAVHEFGHHIGLSHPHDGYDSEYGLDYGPGGDFYFAWSGDESNTVMHYISLTNNFGQFDQDNMYRYEFAGYMNWSASLLEELLAQPNTKKVDKWIIVAVEKAKLALKAFEKWDYASAARHARQAYNNLATAAEILGFEPASPVVNFLVAPGAQAPHEGDPIRYPDN